MPPPFESGMVRDCFDQQTMVGVMLCGSQDRVIKVCVAFWDIALLQDTPQNLATMLGGAHTT